MMRGIERGGPRGAAWAGVAIAVALGAAAPAAAELFRCRGADGKVLYTDQKSLCPGEDPFEPDAVVLPVEPVPTPERSPDRALPAAQPDPEQAMAEHWRQKKRDAEAAIARVQERRAEMRPYVMHCNRGGYVKTRDDAGIPQVVNCSKLRGEFAALDEKEAAARAYLEKGLREECRKAGCLPGWIR